MNLCRRNACERIDKVNFQFSSQSFYCILLSRSNNNAEYDALASIIEQLPPRADTQAFATTLLICSFNVIKNSLKSHFYLYSYLFVIRQLDASRAELQRLEDVSRSLDQQVGFKIVFR